MVAASAVSKTAAVLSGASPTLAHEALGDTDPSALVGLILGWVSAAMYLLARLPQIIRNVRAGCDGLLCVSLLNRKCCELMNGVHVCGRVDSSSAES